MSELVAVCVVWPPNGRAPNRVIFQRRVSYLRNDYEEHLNDSQIAGLEKVIEVFANDSPDFLGRLIEIDKKRVAASGHRMRRYVGAEQKDLYYPERGDLIERHSRRVAGVWIADNLNAQSKFALIQEACEAAGVPRIRLKDLDWVKAAQPRSQTRIVKAALSTSPPRAA